LDFGFWFLVFGFWIFGFWIFGFLFLRLSTRRRNIFPWYFFRTPVDNISWVDISVGGPVDHFLAASLLEGYGWGV
jgi:hypothetical protein